MTTTTHFLTPLLEEFAAKVDAAVSAAQANIYAQLAGVVSAVTQAAPTVPAKGAKRSPAALEEDVANVFAVIQANPGLRIEQLSAILNMPTKDMALPIRKLRAAKQIVTRGQKRSTTYTAKAAR